MLRILKQKAMNRGDADLQSSNDSQQYPEWTYPKPHAPTIVSHIPISIGTHQRDSTSCSSSTISSKGDARATISEPGHVAISHDVVQVSRTRKSEEGLLESHEDSPVESSHLVCPVIVSPTTPAVPSSLLFKVPSRRRRTVSMDDFVLRQDHHQSLGLPSRKKKRPRLTRNRDEVDSPNEFATLLGSNVDTTTNTTSTSSGSTIPATGIMLGTSQDTQRLNPLHVLVRQQIEVFVATETELQQPAPGRKQPIRMSQVGLRCIHCKDQPRETRVKRAVCYPTNIGRMYSAVSDMKFDHFNHCQNLPADIRIRFEELKKTEQQQQQQLQEVAEEYPPEQVMMNKKNDNKRKSRALSTSRYYCESAISLGMMDGPGGIFMSRPSSSPSSLDASGGNKSSGTGQNSSPPRVSLLPIQQTNQSPSVSRPTIWKKAPASTKTTTPSSSHSQDEEDDEMRMMIPVPPPPQQQSRSLREDSDVDNLNTIHCFVREHTEFFAAQEEDITAPSPGRKMKILHGQVGIRCIHCTTVSMLSQQQQSSTRVKRAVCYPPRIDGIYHAISNMKFDHFAKCPGLPDSIRTEFQSLQDSFCRKGSGGNTGGAASSTKKYYRSSAIRLGLIDTAHGIRFQTSPPPQQRPKTILPTTKTTRITTAVEAIVVGAEPPLPPVVEEVASSSSTTSRSPSPSSSVTSDRMSALVEVACLAV